MELFICPPLPLWLRLVAHDGGIMAMHGARWLDPYVVDPDGSALAFITLLVVSVFPIMSLWNFTAHYV